MKIILMFFLKKFSFKAVVSFKPQNDVSSKIWSCSNFFKKNLQNEAGQEIHQNCINPNQDGFFIGLFWGGMG